MKNKCFYFQDKHSLDLHSDSTNSIDKSAFATSPSAPTPQYSFVTTEFNSENTTQGSLTPNHNNFLPMMPGKTSENVIFSLTTNDQLLCLSK